MFETHTTADGTTLRIYQMTDSHLINTIRLGLRRGLAMRAQTESPITDASAVNLELYAKTRDAASVAASIKNILIPQLYPYIAEAALRGLTDQFVDDLRAVVGRTGQVAGADGFVEQLIDPDINEEFARFKRAALRAAEWHEED